MQDGSGAKAGLPVGSHGAAVRGAGEEKISADRQPQNEEQAQGKESAELEGHDGKRRDVTAAVEGKGPEWRV